MSQTWNLSELFESFEDPKFSEAMEACISMAKNTDSLVDEILEKDSPKEILEAYLKYSEKLRMTFSGVMSFSSLSFSADSNNKNALMYLNKLQNLNALMVAGQVRFEKWLSGLENLDEILMQSDYLKEHKGFFNQMLLKSKYSLDEKSETIIAKMRSNGGYAWDTLQKKTTSGITEKVEINGEIKELPLQSIRNLAFEKDPKLRKIGYDAEMKAYKAHDYISAAALNGIKGESLTLCELKGYESPLEQTLINSKMTKETLDAMLSAIKKRLPKFREYLKTKGKLMGHEQGLPFYDMLAPLGDSDITFPYEKGKALVLEQFKNYSQKLHDFALRAFSNGWIDLEPRKGKAGGAFCAPVLPLKESRVLLNYTGKLNNAITTAHELGHAYHNENMFTGSVLNVGSPMPLAETASIFCETIVKRAAIDKATPEDAFGILEVAIQGYNQVIVDIYSRYIFETHLFEARKNGPLSPEDICKLMVEAQEASYGDGLNDIKHPYMWMNKVHYYMPTRDFYNFPYAFGLLFAKGLYGKYQEMGQEFIPKFDHLLASTGKLTVEEAAMLLDIDVTDENFWLQSLDVIGQEIDTFIDLSKKVTL